MNYQQLLDSLLSTIQGWIQDKIDLASLYRDEALGFRNNANYYRAQAETAAAASEASAQNSANAATAAVQQAVNDLVDQAPETLDTLAELAEALGNDPAFATTVTAALGERAKTVDVNALVDGINAALANKSDKGHKHVSSDITDAVDASTGTPAAGKLAKFNQSGTITVARTPSGSTELVNKGYVDGEVATRASNISMTVAEFQAGTSTNNRVLQPDRLKAAIQYHGVAQATSGSGLTLWAGNQNAYDALPSATKNAAGFVAIISG